MPRGQKPKPSELRRLQGNPGHRPIPQELDIGSGKLIAPDHLTAGAMKIWKRDIGRASWLTWADQMKCELYCALYDTFVNEGIEGMTAGMVSQLRVVAAELGFDPSARTRMGANLKEGSGGVPPVEEKANGTTGGNVTPITKSQKYFK